MIAKEMKAKQCSQCPYAGSLWKSSPPLCKNCAMVYNATHKVKVAHIASNEVTKAKKHYVIPKTSDKQAKINQVYTVLRKQYLKDHPNCEAEHDLKIGCLGVATDIHHKASGSNKRKHYLDTTTWISVCHFCHHCIHDVFSADKLYELGLKIRT